MRSASPLFLSLLAPMVFLSHSALTGFAANHIQEDSINARTSSNSSQDQLPTKAVLRLGIQDVGHSFPILQTAISKNGKQIFTIDNGSLIAWEKDSGKPLWKKKLTYSHQSTASPASFGIRPFAIMPDSGKVVTSSRNGRLKFWDPQTGKSKTIKCPISTTWKSIDISPDAQLFAVGDGTGLWVCNPEGKKIYSLNNRPQNEPAQQNDIGLPAGRQHYCYARFSPDGKHLALVRSNDPTTVWILDAPSGDEVLRFTSTFPVARLDFSPDSTKIATREGDQATRLYDANTGENLWEHTPEAKADPILLRFDLNHSPDGSQIAVNEFVDSRTQIKVLDTLTGQPISRFTLPSGDICPIQYTLDNQRLVCSLSGSLVRSWDVETGEAVPVDNEMRANGVGAMSGDGKQLAFVDMESNIHLVDIATGSILQTLKEPDSHSIGQITFNRTGTQLGVGYAHEGEICLAIWDVAESMQIHRWSWAVGESELTTIGRACFSPDGQKIAASVFHQNAAYVFDLATDKQLAKIPHENVTGLNLNHDGSKIYTAGSDGTIRVWDCHTQKELARKLVKNDQGVAVKFSNLKLSHSQKIIAASDTNSRIRLFDAKLNSLGTIDGLGDLSYGSIDFSHNDLWISAGTKIGLIVFDIATGERVFYVKAHDQPMITSDFGTNSRYLLSGGYDGVCYLWDTIPKKSNPKDIPEYYQRLTGVGGNESFTAFHRLAETPQETFRFMDKKLRGIATEQVPEREVAKWIAAIGSSSSRKISIAKRKLWELGPTAYPQLIEALETDTASPKKRAQIRELAVSIHCRYRRAIMLFAELDIPEVDESINEMLEKSASSHWTSLLKDAQEMRDARQRIDDSR